MRNATSWKEMGSSSKEYLSKPSFSRDRISWSSGIIESFLTRGEKAIPIGL